MEKDNWDPEFIKKMKIENEKRKKHLAAKKKRMYKKRIISIALLVMFLLCIITVIKSCTSGNGSLDSRDGFIEFTNEKIKCGSGTITAWIWGRAKAAAPQPRPSGGPSWRKRQRYQPVEWRLIFRRGCKEAMVPARVARPAAVFLG